MHDHNGSRQRLLRQAEQSSKPNLRPRKGKNVQVTLPMDKASVSQECDTTLVCTNHSSVRSLSVADEDSRPSSQLLTDVTNSTTMTSNQAEVEPPASPSRILAKPNCYNTVINGAEAPKRSTSRKREPRPPPTDTAPKQKRKRAVKAKETDPTPEDATTVYPNPPPSAKQKKSARKNNVQNPLFVQIDPENCVEKKKAPLQTSRYAANIKLAPSKANSIDLMTPDGYFDTASPAISNTDTSSFGSSPMSVSEQCRFPDGVTWPVSNADGDKSDDKRSKSVLSPVAEEASSSSINTAEEAETTDVVMPVAQHACPLPSQVEPVTVLKPVTSGGQHAVTSALSMLTPSLNNSRRAMQQVTNGSSNVATNPTVSAIAKPLIKGRSGTRSVNQMMGNPKFDPTKPIVMEDPKEKHNESCHKYINPYIGNYTKPPLQPFHVRFPPMPQTDHDEVKPTDSLVPFYSTISSKTPLKTSDAMAMFKGVCNNRTRVSSLEQQDSPNQQPPEVQQGDTLMISEEKIDAIKKHFGLSTDGEVMDKVIELYQITTEAKEQQRLMAEQARLAPRSPKKPAVAFKELPKIPAKFDRVKKPKTKKVVPEAPKKHIIKKHPTHKIYGERMTTEDRAYLRVRRMTKATCRNFIKRWMPNPFETKWYAQAAVISRTQPHLKSTRILIRRPEELPNLQSNVPTPKAPSIETAEPWKFAIPEDYPQTATKYEEIIQRGHARLRRRSSDFHWSEYTPARLRNFKIFWKKLAFEKRPLETIDDCLARRTLISKYQYELKMRRKAHVVMDYFKKLRKMRIERIQSFLRKHKRHALTAKLKASRKKYKRTFWRRYLHRRMWRNEPVQRFKELQLKIAPLNVEKGDWDVQECYLNPKRKKGTSTAEADSPTKRSKTSKRKASLTPSVDETAPRRTKAQSKPRAKRAASRGSTARGSPATSNPQPSDEKSVSRSSSRSTRQSRTLAITQADTVAVSVVNGRAVSPVRQSCANTPLPNCASVAESDQSDVVRRRYPARNRITKKVTYPGEDDAPNLTASGNQTFNAAPLPNVIPQQDNSFSVSSTVPATDQPYPPPDRRRTRSMVQTSAASGTTVTETNDTGLSSDNTSNSSIVTSNSRTRSMLPNPSSTRNSDSEGTTESQSTLYPCLRSVVATKPRTPPKLATVAPIKPVRQPAATDSTCSLPPAETVQKAPVLDSTEQPKPEVSLAPRTLRKRPQPLKNASKITEVRRDSIASPLPKRSKKSTRAAAEKKKASNEASNTAQEGTTTLCAPPKTSKSAERVMEDLEFVMITCGEEATDAYYAEIRQEIDTDWTKVKYPLDFRVTQWEIDNFKVMGVSAAQKEVDDIEALNEPDVAQTKFDELRSTVKADWDKVKFPPLVVDKDVNVSQSSNNSARSSNPTKDTQKAMPKKFANNDVTSEAYKRFLQEKIGIPTPKLELDPVVAKEALNKLFAKLDPTVHKN